METRDAVTTGNQSLTRTALLLAGAGVLVMVVLAAMDHDGAGWILQPILGIAAAVTAWRAGGTSPRNLPAFIALIIGVILTLIFLGFLVSGD
jgi:glycerol uptake facilitator-like aquaporin